MAQLQFTVRERQDRGPLAGVTVHVVPLLVFRWRTGLDLPAPGPASPTVSGDGIGDARIGSEVGDRSDEPRHHEQTYGLPAVQAVTDSAGEVAFSWDPASPDITTLVLAHSKPLYDRLPTVLMAFRIAVTLPGAARRQTGVGRLALGGLLSRRIDLDGMYVGGIALDLACTIVGHCSIASVAGGPATASARLWFGVWSDVPGTARVVVAASAVGSTVGPGRPARKPISMPVPLPRTGVRTAVVDVPGLAPATAYSYRLEVALPVPRGAPALVWTIARGSFLTPDPATVDHRLAFASCQPTNPDRQRPTSWQRLDAWNPDDVLLLGDQVYGDYTDPTLADRAKDAAWTGAPPPTATPPAGGWRAFYDRRYRSAWASPIVREVMRRRPIYMMLDDHDVADDWGTKFTVGDRPDQVTAALAAFEAFQHAHNPSPSTPRLPGEGYDYGIDRGWLQAYVVDARSGRRPTVKPNPAPVLGLPQRARITRWAADPVTRAADVIVLASPTPLALLDAAGLAAAIRRIEPVVEVASDVSQGLNAVTETVIGWGSPSFDNPFEITDGEVTEPDLADQWNDPDNRPDLRFVLDTLFGLQNDIAGSGSHRRAVIVISGDAHVGAFHRIQSSDPAHADNPVIYQVTASPIGVQSSMGTITKILSIVNDSAWPIPLVGPYTARMLGAFGRVNVGSLASARIPGPGRRYELRAALSFEPAASPLARLGNEARLDLMFDLDRPGRPTDLWDPPEVRFGRG